MASILNVDQITATATDGNITATPNGTGIFVPKKVPAFYAFNSSPQNLTNGTWTKVTGLSSELYDNTNHFDTANQRFVAPVNGIYCFTTCLNFGTNTSSGGYMYAEVRKTFANGSTAEYYTTGIRITNTVITSDTQINGTISLPLLANEIAEMWAYQNVTSGNPTLNGGRCFFTGHLVSGT